MQFSKILLVAFCTTAIAVPLAVPSPDTNTGMIEKRRFPPQLIRLLSGGLSSAMFKAFKNKGAKRRDLTLEDLQRRQDEAADEDMEAQLKADIEEALKPLEKELTNDDKEVEALKKDVEKLEEEAGSAEGGAEGGAEGDAEGDAEEEG